ncbi:MAG: lipid-A-disaccharide synthase, partial [Pseudomonadota bacterium]
MSILLAAVEPSADALGASLVAALRDRAPDIKVFGCGGALMGAAGFESAFDTGELAVMGFTDVVRALPVGFQRARELAALARAQAADAAVLIDGWAFSRITAKRLRALSPQTKVFKYAAPQVWASRPQRVDFVKHYFDGVLTLLPFEPPWFDRVGVQAAFVGNPTFEKAYGARGDGAAFRARHNIDASPALLVAPGSRRSEITHIAPVFVETANLLSKQVPALKIIVAPAPAVAEETRAALATIKAPVFFAEPAEKYDAFAAADVALAASGTVTTELAINKTPTVVAYRADVLTAFWARRVVTSPFASIVNVAAG